MTPVVTDLPHILTVQQQPAPIRMLPSASSLLLPLALTTSLGAAPPAHEVRALVTGYNTVPAQTDSTPCIAASGADICGRPDAVACPRRIDLGTVVEIRGIAYTCEDRLAKKYDRRFDISCDKDMACPYEVAGWTTVTVYGDVPPAAPKPAIEKHPKRKPEMTQLVGRAALTHPVVVAKAVAKSGPRPVFHAVTGMLASAAHRVIVLRGHG
jgi:hypothetical protein